MLCLGRLEICRWCRFDVGKPKKNAMIGLRILFLVAMLAVSITFLGYLFTQNPKLLRLTKIILKVTAGFVVLVAVVYILERLFFL